MVESGLPRLKKGRSSTGFLNSSAAKGFVLYQSYS